MITKDMENVSLDLDNLLILKGILDLLMKELKEKPRKIHDEIQWLQERYAHLIKSKDLIFKVKEFQAHVLSSNDLLELSELNIALIKSLELIGVQIGQVFELFHPEEDLKLKKRLEGKETTNQKDKGEYQ